jgi:hypothetical protein
VCGSQSPVKALIKEEIRKKIRKYGAGDNKAEAHKTRKIEGIRK